MDRANRLIAVTSDILFYRDPDEQIQAVLLEDGQPVEWIRPQQPGSALRQDIILGRVESIDRSLSSVFVAIGQPENGMLPLKEAPATIRVGQPILVQIRRLTASAEKGHLLTSRIQYPGLFVVYEPAGERLIQRSKARELDPAVKASLSANELAILNVQHQQVADSAAADGSLPRTLHRPGEPLITALQSWLRDDLRTIHVSDLDLFKAVDQFLATRWPAMIPKLRLHSGDYDLPSVFRLADLPRLASRRRILLKNGGSVVFDQTEALLAIDVNTGKASATAPSRLRLQTNLLAAAEIARQLRLRNIDGIVVIDFIRMADIEDRQELTSVFATALSADRGKITIGGLTTLGLFELVRQVP